MTTRTDKAPRKHEDIKKAVKKGLVIVNTGGGKGKSTAAFGTAIRALGRGYKVAIIQFIKGKWVTGEIKFLERFSEQCHVFIMGEGFTWDTLSIEKDVMAARGAWEKCREVLQDKEHEVVIFDEINYALKYNFLDVQEIVNELKRKPFLKHVILTGNGAPQELIDFADLVTEMKCIKHPYQQGIKAQAGIDY